MDSGMRLQLLFFFLRFSPCSQHVKSQIQTDSSLIKPETVNTCTRMVSSNCGSDLQIIMQSPLLINSRPRHTLLATRRQSANRNSAMKIGFPLTCPVRILFLFLSGMPNHSKLKSSSHGLSGVHGQCCGEWPPTKLTIERSQPPTKI